MIEEINLILTDFKWNVNIFTMGYKLDELYKSRLDFGSEVNSLNLFSKEAKLPLKYI